METWQQIYLPLGSLGLSAFVAALPILFFFVALAGLRLKGHVAGALTLAIALLIALFVYRMPVDKALASAGYGFLYGLWPIAWIIVTAVFLYKLTVKCGQFDIIRSSVLSITDDQRLQVLLIGFCFGAFLEGAAGFGAPVAITAALLVGLGHNPLKAAGLCLIANTAPVAFGALGIPTIVAGQVTGIDAFKIGAMTGRQLPLLSLLVPLWLMFMMDGMRGLRETWKPALICGGTFAVFQYLTSNFIGPELPDITSSLAAMIARSSGDEASDVCARGWCSGCGCIRDWRTSMRCSSRRSFSLSVMASLLSHPWRNDVRMNGCPRLAAKRLPPWNQMASTTRPFAGCNCPWASRSTAASPARTRATATSPRQARSAAMSSPSATR